MFASHALNPATGAGAGAAAGAGALVAAGAALVAVGATDGSRHWPVWSLKPESGVNCSARRRLWAGTSKAMHPTRLSPAAILTSLAKPVPHGPAETIVESACWLPFSSSVAPLDGE